MGITDPQDRDTATAIYKDKVNRVAAKFGFGIGDAVGYKSVKTDAAFQHVGKVYDVWPDGIPSCGEPMLKIEGKSGCVLASHCVLISPEVWRLRIEARDRQAVLLCEEAHPSSREKFIPCAAPAARFILSERGKKVYAMCAGCASHNTHNRGAEDLGPAIEVYKMETMK